MLEHLRIKDKLALDLQCAPPESESFWRKEGFVEFPFSERQSSLQNLWLWKVLAPTANCTPLHSVGDFIALWNVEPHLAKTHQVDPNWTWQVNFREGTNQLILPVVFPCQRDWQVQLICNGIIYESKKAKYFNNEISYNDKFLIVTSLPV